MTETGGIDQTSADQASGDQIGSDPVRARPGLSFWQHADSGFETRDLFVQLWGTALLFHLISNPQGLTTFGLPFIIDLLLGLTAAAAVLAPKRVGFIAAAAAVQVVDGWVSAPVVGNHAALLVLVNLALLVSMGWSALRTARGRSGRTWFQLFAPGARLTLLSAYAFMAFSKLNSGFFDLLESCAPIFAEELVQLTSLSIEGQPSLQAAAIWGAAIAELSVPFLLVLAPRLGVPFAIGLHFVFSIDPVGHVFDFSSMLFALFLLFWPPLFGDGVGRNGLLGWRPRLVQIGGIGLALWAVLFAVSGVAALLVIWPLWLWYGGAVLVHVIRTAGDSNSWHAPEAEAPRPSRAFWRGLTPALGVIVLLSVLNGVSPYLELKSNYAWNMYSNLRAEAGETNHFIVPRTLALRDAHEQVVTIVETDDEDLAPYLEDNLGLTVQSLQVYLDQNPDAALTYALDGAQVQVKSGERPAAIGEPPGLFIRKLGPFRAIDLDDEKGCLRSWAPAH